MPFFAFLAGAGAALGGIVLIVGFAFANSAPQEASIAALAIALAVIPYVFFRAMQLSRQVSEARKFKEDVLQRLDALDRAP